MPIKREKEEKSEGGLILKIKSETDLEFDQEAYTIGKVLALGPGCFNETPESPWFKIGDLVQFYKHSGIAVDKEAAGIEDEYLYRTIYDKDVQHVIKTSEDK